MTSKPMKRRRFTNVLSFKSPNLKPCNERNLQCRLPSRANYSSTPANTAAINKRIAAINLYPSCSAAIAAPAAANRWTTSITTYWSKNQNRRNKKMPPRREDVAATIPRWLHGLRSGRRNEEGSRRGSRGLLNLRHTVSGMRVYIGTQLVWCYLPINCLSNCNYIFSRRHLFFAEVQPFPDMTLANFAAWYVRNNGICQHDLPTYQIDCFL